jgi:peptidyl-prolyl cis-trans isomerase D
MFEFVRSHTKLFQFLLLIVIVPGFVIGWGLSGYNNFSENRVNTVAVVAGEPITRTQWDAAHQRQIERLRAQMPNVDIKLLDTPEMRQRTLDELVRERVLYAAAADLHLGVTAPRLVHALETMPELAEVRGPDGRIDREKYKQLLAARGLSEAGFEQRLREDLMLQQVLQGIESTSFAPDSVAKISLDALLQQREVQVQRFDPKDYAAKVNPTDAQLQAYYDNPANQTQFKAPEQATIDYAVLDLDALAKGITVSDKDLHDYYEQNKSRYTVPEERQARHILIQVDKNAPADVRAKAKARAEQILAELRKNPGSFAELAKKDSQDAGSKDNGGELGFFTRDAMTKPFADAVWTMKPGQISDVVESDYGYHIIELEAVRGGDVKPFEAVRASIEDEVRKQLAQKRYADAAEQFSNLVYEEADSLQPAIDKLHLQKQTATVQRTPAPGTQGPLASSKFLDAVFSNDALRNKHNTEAVETAPYQMVAAHVVQYSPAHLMPFAQVKDRVREHVVQQQAAELARKDGEARLAQLKQSNDGAGLPAAAWVSRDKAGDLPPKVLDAALGANASKLPTTLGVDLGDQGYAVLRIDQLRNPDPNTEPMKSLLPRYASAWGEAAAQAYLDALKQRYKVEIKSGALQAADATASH